MYIGDFTLNDIEKLEKEKENTLKKIEELCKKYEDTWGKKVDYTIIPIGITQEKFVKCLELMITDNLSLVVAYNKVFKK